MKKIFKYELAGEDHQVLSLPVGAVILSADIQKIQTSKFCIWAMVDPEEKQTEDRSIWIVGTGWEMTDILVERMCFINTVQINSLVFHLFKEA